MDYLHEWQHDNMLITFKDIYILEQQDEKSKLGIGVDDIAIQAKFHIADVNDTAISDWVHRYFI